MGWVMPFFFVHSPLQKFCPLSDIHAASSTKHDARDIFLQNICHRYELCI